MTKIRQIDDKSKAKLSQDPRETKCRANPFGKHRWAQSFKEKLSKTRYVQILRCRYCTDFLMADFERVMMPSGRVTATVTVTAITAAEARAQVPVKLQRCEQPAGHDESACESDAVRGLAEASAP